ncbi:MAG: thioredoxin family protein, partial [Bacteroidota bacterium]|jgi:thioredoxin 1
MKKESVQEIQNLVTQSSKVIVKIGATWCGPCKLLTPTLEQLEQEFESVAFYDVALDTTEDSIFCGEHYSKTIPFTLFFLNGERVHALSGDVPINRIRQDIEKHLA